MTCCHCACGANQRCWRAWRWTSAREIDYQFFPPQLSQLSLRMCSKPALMEGLEVNYYLWSWLSINQTPLDCYHCACAANWRCWRAWRWTVICGASYQSISQFFPHCYHCACSANRRCWRAWRRTVICGAGYQSIKLF
jgi:hypothetical protein